MAACTLHNDGKNYWLVFSDDQYLYAYKVNQQGVDVVPIKTRLYTQEQPCTFSFSNSGYKFCMCYDEHTEIYEFNKTSGVFVHVQTLSVSSYFSCFSPDETKLYLSDIVSSGSATYGLSKVYQYDFTENHLYTLLTENLNNGVSYALQAAPDNKIYLGFVGKKSLEVINEPNLAGTACDLQKNAISLGNGMMQLMFPLFVQSYFAPPNFYYQKINCSSSPVQFLISGVGSYFSILWDFGDGSTSTDLNPSHTYVNSGTYTVQVTVTYEDGTSQSLTKTITIIEKPKTLTINHN